jgi:hypothetical protein
MEIEVVSTVLDGEWMSERRGTRRYGRGEAKEK